MDELSISLPIAGRSYRLSIAREHEELFRNAAKLIDKRILDYSNSYAYKDKQDLLAMAALEYATGYLQNDSILVAKEESLRERLEAVDAALDEMLK